MTLMLHAGAQPLDLEALASLPVPAPTKTHVPIPHPDVVGMVKYALGYYGHEIVEEHYGATKDGARFFGLMTLRSAYGDYTDTVGLRNSHDKKFPIGISFGSRVFVCDNLAFIGDHVVKRRHTQNAKRDLPGLLAEIVEPLAETRKAQAVKFDRYKSTPLSPLEADGAIMQIYRRGVINVQRIAAVAEAWDDAPYDWGEQSAWRLFNAVTHTLEGRIAEDPRVTEKLHAVIDGVCERVG